MLGYVDEIPRFALTSCARGEGETTINIRGEESREV